jgi:hypothetical protein
VSFASTAPVVRSSTFIICLTHLPVVEVGEQMFKKERERDRQQRLDVNKRL